VLDHLKQRVGLLNPVQRPAGIEYFVAAMLGIGLGEHHQLNVRGVAAQLGKAAYQIINFIISQGQP
jgi:hypothetical protein